MKAVVYEKYGSPDVLQHKELEKPAPKKNEVLVRIHAASLNMYDWHLLTADIFLVRLSTGLLNPKPSIPGADIAGRVEAVGANVTQFKPGDEVFGDIAGSGSGGFAEYAAVPEKLLAPKPANLTFEEAAALPMAGITALQGLRDVAQIKRGQRVLIQGAAGGVGSYAVQLARHYGAEVTAVCSARNHDQARALGAHHLIDYTRQDFTRAGQQYDLIFAVNGYHSLSDYSRALAPTGMYAMAGGNARQIFETLLLGSLMSKISGRKMNIVSAKHSQADLLVLKELVEAGQLVPVIDRRFPLAQAAEAMRYHGAGHARGKVIITVDQAGASA